MSIEGSLAQSWKPLTGENGWRFNLRQGVTFQDGSPFNSKDVMFSYERASSEAADVRSWFAPVKEVRVVDDYTIDFVTNAPNPLFPDSIANFMILDKGWAEANGAELPVSAEMIERSNMPFNVVEYAPNTLPNQPEKVNLFGDLLMLSAHKSMPEDVVYEFVRVLVENAEKIQGYHGFLKPLTPQTLAHTAQEKPEAFHTGAIRAFKDLGLIK
jgi:hypothetical protein